MVSDSGCWLNRLRVLLGRGCAGGVVGLNRQATAVVWNVVCVCEVNGLGCLAVDRDSRVAGYTCVALGFVPE